MPSAAPDLESSFLDRSFPLVARVVLLFLCALVPTVYIGLQCEKRDDLTQVIFFGQKFQLTALPEIQELKTATCGTAGYDGQFYAQIALDPTLREPGLAKALDYPNLRSQRIVLPALAYVAGFGSPVAVLRAYALLNLVFWYILFFALAWYLGVKSAREFLIFYAIMLTTGALISIQRALTDLPAATLGFLSISLADAPAAVLIAAAILTKPTGGLFLMRYLSPFPRTLHDWLGKAGMVLLALLPPVLWQLYIYHALGEPFSDGNNFNIPFHDWWIRVVESWQTLASTPVSFVAQEVTQWEWNLFEFLALMSITLQSAFLLLMPRWQNPVWLMGVGFAGLFFCLTHNTYVEQIGYTRTVLPVTIAFNILLLENRRSPLFVPYFIAGNIGLVLTLHDMVGFPFR